MTNYAPSRRHGELTEVFKDVYFVTGTTCPNFDGETWQFSKNMTVVREGEDLTLINTLRLDEAGLEQLDSLGTVKNVVRLGAFHGMDDAFYVDKYSAKLWAMSGISDERGKTVDNELIEGGAMPFSGCSVFRYKTSDMPEGLLIIDRAGGILVSCDSLQNWEEVDQYFDEASAQKTVGAGFIKPANVGPGWMRFANPEKKDFDAVLDLNFQHLLSAHGTPLKKEAKLKLSQTFKSLFTP